MANREFCKAGLHNWLESRRWNSALPGFFCGACSYAATKIRRQAINDVTYEVANFTRWNDVWDDVDMLMQSGSDLIEVARRIHVRPGTLERALARRKAKLKLTA